MKHNDNERHPSLRAWVSLVVIAAMVTASMAAPPDVTGGEEPPQEAVAARPGSTPARFARIQPQIPSANRSERNKVFIENADEMVFDEARSADYQVLRGNVRFSRAGMFMYCDSAYFHPESSSLDAFGHVRMTRGGGEEGTCEVLHYYADREVAEMRRNVVLRNRNMTLTTDSLDYDMAANMGYYYNGGKIVDSKGNVLESEECSYNTRTDDATFDNFVTLNNPKFELSTRSLLYNTRTHIATIIDETDIYSKGRDRNHIRTNSGYYNTSADNGTLYNRSLIETSDDRDMVGDTLFYDRREGYGEARGNIIINDYKNKTILDGDYGYHNERTHYSFVTKRARARITQTIKNEYGNLEEETLHVHADTLRTFLDEDSIRVVTAQHDVRYYRSDVQGLCDSAAMSQRDSIMNMYRHAVVWNENHQVVGDEINVHFNDSTADWAMLPAGGMLAEELGEHYYNQLSGKKMMAFFEDKELRRLEVDGNVRVIFYPEEQDSTINKQVAAESSHLNIDLKEKQEVDKIKMWPNVSGTVTPLFLLKPSGLYLSGFKWYGDLRPQGPDDIFDTTIDPSTIDAPVVGRRRSTSAK
ncbi:MAG: hypothetical protein J6X70_10700 [Muribaculaceae bacterium]|nr:hypothetical protein [Muribaculaceae bacterium]